MQRVMNKDDDKKKKKRGKKKKQNTFPKTIPLRLLVFLVHDAFCQLLCCPQPNIVQG
jgi:hypothetical protein